MKKKKPNGLQPKASPPEIIWFAHNQESETNPIHFPVTQKLKDSLQKWKIAGDKLWSGAAFTAGCF